MVTMNETLVLFNSYFLNPTFYFVISFGYLQNSPIFAELLVVPEYSPSYYRVAKKKLKAPNVNSNILFSKAKIWLIKLKENFWRNEKKLQILQNHWDIWIPSRTRIELDMIVTCMVQQHLEIFCGLKSGKINVYDHNLRLVSVLGNVEL